jgi:O-antigen/teichoic acid export membrane protein
MNGQAKTEEAASHAGWIRERLARGASVYAATNFGLKALGFVILAIYSRFLTPRDFGIVGIVESVGIAIGILSGLGMESGCRRLYFHFPENSEELSSYFSTVLRLAAGAGIAVLATAFLLGPWITHRIAPGWQASFFPYMALPILTAIASQVLACRLIIFQCQGRYFASSAFVAFQSLLTTLLTLVLVVWMHHGAVGLLVARALGACLTLTVAVCRSGPLLRAQARWVYFRETLQISLPLVLHSMMAMGLIAIDRFILQHYRPLSEVGLYSVAYSIGLVMPTVTVTLNRAWAPLFYSLQRNGEQGRKIAGDISADLALLLALVASLGALLSPLFIHMFLDRRYWPAASIAPIILGAYLCHALFTLLQLSLIQTRRTGLVTLVSGAALLANILLNFAWIPRYGMTGAAYATLAAYVGELILAAAIAQRAYRLPFGWLRPLLALLAGTISVAWTRFTPPVTATLAFAGLLFAICVAMASITLRTRFRPSKA